MISSTAAELLGQRELRVNFSLMHLVEGFLFEWMMGLWLEEISSSLCKEIYDFFVELMKIALLIPSMQ